MDRAARRAQRDRNRAHLLRYLLAHPCADCGEADPVVLDCHHVDPGRKGGDVSTLVAKGLPWKLVRRELEKTVTLCANCHRRRHAEADQCWRVRLLAPLKLP
jgi:hypothetical protein